MAKESNIVHEYYKKTTDEGDILVRLNPFTFQGIEVFRHVDGSLESRELQFDEHIHEDLRLDDFQPSSPLEFHLYASGLA